MRFIHNILTNLFAAQISTAVFRHELVSQDKVTYIDKIIAARFNET